MITIHLNHIHFHAFHGLYEEEKILGNDYIIDASVHFKEKDLITSIDKTINYVSIYNIIKTRMEIPALLLETVVMDIGSEIYKHFPNIGSVKISIKKMHPPIAGIEGYVGVTWEKQFET